MTPSSQLLRLCGRLSRCAHSRRHLAASGSGSSAPSGGPPPRPPAKPRADNAPLYESLRRERRTLTERVMQEKLRAQLRSRQFDDAAEGGGPSLLQAARQRPPELPANCLPWRDYALFADSPALRPLKSLEEDSAENGGSFASLLRRSSFVGLGNFENRVLRGRVFERFEGSLYVDFGGKFHAVCPAPRVNSEKYVRGAQVTLRLIDPEMTSRFLGSERHITLAEADAVLLGLWTGPGGGGSPEVAAGPHADTESPLREALMQAMLDEAAVAADPDGGGSGGGGGGVDLLGGDGYGEQLDV